MTPGLKNMRARGWRRTRTTVTAPSTIRDFSASPSVYGAHDGRLGAPAMALGLFIIEALRRERWPVGFEIEY